MNLKKTLFLCVLSGIAAGQAGCLGIDDFLNVNRVEEDPDSGKKPTFEPGESGTQIDPTDTGDVVKPGGSQGVEGGEDDDDDEIDPGGTTIDEPFSLTSIAPSSGPLSGGYEIQLKGAQYSRTDRVMIGALESSKTTFVSGLVMRATVPAGHRGCVDVKIERADGSESVTLKDGFCYTEQVTVASVEPSVAVEGAITPVVIRGTGFEKTMSVYAQSGEEVRALLDIVPGDGVVEAVLPSLSAGEATLVVNTSNGQTELKDALKILPKLEVSEIVPQVVAANTPAVLEISGSGFEAAAVKGLVGSTQGTANVLGDAKMQLSIGGLAPACYDVVVYDSYRQKRADKALYVVDDAGNTEIAGVLPSRGPLSGGTAKIVGVLPSTGEVKFGESAGEVLKREALSWEVKVPAVSSPRTVDVSVDGVELKNAYSYVAEPVWTSISPSHGNAGTEVTLKGSGFDETLRVFADQFEAEQVEVVDSTTVKASMPLGSGTAKINLIQNDTAYATNLTFTYDESLALFGVTPSEIATIGGTSVTLHGQGFSSDYRVVLDGVVIEDVVWNGAGSATFVSPSHSAGPSVVELQEESGKTVASAEVLFYEPSGLNSHISGGALDGRMNVTVMTVKTNELIAGADVYVDAGGEAYLHATTNGSGQAAFESSSLTGTQIVYACYPGYSCNTIQSFNARDVTIYLEKWEREEAGSTTVTPPIENPPDDGSSINPIDYTVTYPPEDSYITGKVSGFDKIDLETATEGDWVRAALVIQSQLSPYVGGYTQGDVYLLFEEGAKYKLKARKGDVAVGLVCGLYNTQTTEFDARYFGVRTGLYVTSGVTLTADINCPLPLNQTQSVKMLNIPHGETSTELSATAFLNMGNYGYIGGFMKGHSDNDLVIITKIPPLRGQLEGASLALQTYLYRDSVYTGTFYSYGIDKNDNPVEVGPLVSLPKFDVLPDENYYTVNDNQKTLHNGKAFMKRGRVTWSVEHPEYVDFYALTIRGYYSGSNQLLWQFYLPRNATSAEFMGDRDYQFEGVDPSAIYVTLTAYKSLRDGYDFNSFSTLDMKYSVVDSSASTSMYMPWVNYYGE